MTRSGLTLGLAFLATSFLLACQDPGPNPTGTDLPGPQFGHKSGHNPGGGGGGGGDEKPQECQLGFDLTFDDSNPVRSDDGSGMYTNGVDKVAVFTGSGDGFRFDTNGDQKVEWKTDIRRVTLDFTGTVDKDGNSLERLMETDAAGDPVPKGIDLRFKQGAVHTDGLNLCALDHEGISGPTSGTVAVGIAFIDSSDPDFKIGEGNNARLSYGDIGGPNVDVDCSIVDEVKVTRTAVDTWELESTDDACLVLGGPLERVFAGEVPMPFKFTIVAQP